MVVDYTVILQPVEGAGWTAFIPDLPGCRSVGRTQEEARTEVSQEAIKWILQAKSEGKAIPAAASKTTTVRMTV
jgi:predicted RNase H-like HicB family nuclease